MQSIKINEKKIELEQCEDFFGKIVIENEIEVVKELREEAKRQKKERSEKELIQNLSFNPNINYPSKEISEEEEKIISSFEIEESDD